MGVRRVVEGGVTEMTENVSGLTGQVCVPVVSIVRREVDAPHKSGYLPRNPQYDSYNVRISSCLVSKKLNPWDKNGICMIKNAY